MTDLTLQPDEAASNDTFIYDGSTTTNYGTNAQLIVGADSTNIWRSLIKFDLTGIAAGATITAATLSLYLDSEASTNACNLEVYRVIKAWTESGATWAKYDGTNTWSTSGCSSTTLDREAANIGSLALSATETTGAWKAINLTAEKVQEMIPGGAWTNNGFLLKIDTDTTKVTKYLFSSATGSNHPKLDITYEAGGIMSTIIIYAD